MDGWLHELIGDSGHCLSSSHGVSAPEVTFEGTEELSWNWDDALKDTEERVWNNLNGGLPEINGIPASFEKDVEFESLQKDLAAHLLEPVSASPSQIVPITPVDDETRGMPVHFSTERHARSMAAAAALACAAERATGLRPYTISNDNPFCELKTKSWPSAPRYSGSLNKKRRIGEPGSCFDFLASESIPSMGGILEPGSGLNSPAFKSAPSMGRSGPRTGGCGLLPVASVIMQAATCEQTASVMSGSSTVTASCMPITGGHLMQMNTRGSLDNKAKCLILGAVRGGTCNISEDRLESSDVYGGSYLQARDQSRSVSEKRSFSSLSRPESEDRLSNQSDQSKGTASVDWKKVLDRRKKCDTDSVHTDQVGAQGGKPAGNKSTEAHRLTEKRRRDRISEKMSTLQAMIPNSNTTDKACMLEEAIAYVKQLQGQLQIATSMVAVGHPFGMAHLYPVPVLVPGMVRSPSGGHQAHMGPNMCVARAIPFVSSRGYHPPS